MISKQIHDNAIIFNTNCIELMDDMIKNNKTVDLTVTSPPYDNLRNYNKSSTWNFDIFKAIADRLYKITSNGGIVVWIVGDETINGGESLTSFRQALYFQEIGFKCHDTMIFEKNSSSFPARRTGKRYTQIFEYMFVFVKGKIKTGNLICDKPNKYAGCVNWGSNTQYNKNGELIKAKDIKPVPDFSPRNNIWKYTVGFNFNVGKHPAVFPYKLAEDHILSWSNEGDIVFDPFLGSGTTCAAALINNRKFIGTEIDETYFSSIEENVDKYLKHHEKNAKPKA